MESFHVGDKVILLKNKAVVEKMQQTIGGWQGFMRRVSFFGSRNLSDNFDSPHLRRPFSYTLVYFYVIHLINKLHKKNFAQLSTYFRQQLTCQTLCSKVVNECPVAKFNLLNSTAASYKQDHSLVHMFLENYKLPNSLGMLLSFVI